VSKSSLIFLNPVFAFNLNLAKYLRWALKYGIPGLAVTNVLSNVVINSAYRSNFLLSPSKHTASLISSFIVSSFFPPAFSATLLHITYLDRLLKVSSSSDECLMCAKIQGLVRHFVIGSFLQTGTAWLSSFYHSSLYLIPKLRVVFQRLARSASTSKRWRGFSDELSKIFTRR